MFGSSNLNSFRDGRQVAVQLVSWSVAARTCSRLLEASLCNCRLASSPAVVRVHVVHPYSSIDTTAAWKKLRFILSVRSDFHIINSLLKAVHAFVNLLSMSFSADATLLPR